MAINAKALADARWHCDQDVLVGISINLSRRRHKGDHRGLVLARRLQAKADRIQDPRVPWTNNASEQALKSPKLHQKVSGYRVTSRTHGLNAIDAIRAGLAGSPWLPHARRGLSTTTP
jgi:hypothetical protein